MAIIAMEPGNIEVYRAPNIAKETTIDCDITNTITYAPYNLDGSLANLTYPSGRVLTYAPGGAGRPLSVVETAHSLNYLTGALYTPSGALSQFASGSSISGALTYNSRQQPLQLYFTTGTISPATLTQLQQAACPTTPAALMSRSYNFGSGTNDNGNVNVITDCLSPNRTQNFFYDNLNRITDAYTNGKTTSASNWGERYTIDPWGNLTNIALEPGGWQHSELLNAAPASTKNQLNGFCHDSAGNLVLNSACPQGMLSPTYTYDAENRLKATNGYTYVYDGDGKRVVKCNGTYPTCSSATLYWTGMGSDALAETDWTGAAVEEYVFFDGRRIARRDGTTNTVKYYLSDHLGSTSIVASSTGAIQKQSMYYPYGGEIPISGANFANNYKFTGKERDTESQLDYFGARYHASSLGRFMTPDWAARPTTVPYAVFGDPQSLNLYGYVRNDPVSRADLDGHSQHCLWGICIGTPDPPPAPPTPKPPQQPPQQAQQQSNRQPDGSYKATPAQLAEIRAADKKGNVVITSPSDPIGQCVTACEHFTGVPGPTTSWKFDKPAMQLTDKNDVGTAIATPGPDGRYPQSGARNSGVWMGQSVGGFWMADQWPNQQPMKIRFVPEHDSNNPDNPSMNGSAYKVIVIPNQ